MKVELRAGGIYAADCAQQRVSGLRMRQTMERELLHVYFTLETRSRRRCGAGRLVLEQRLARILYGLHGAFEIEGPAERDLTVVVRERGDGCGSGTRHFEQLLNVDPETSGCEDKWRFHRSCVLSRRLDGFSLRCCIIQKQRGRRHKRMRYDHHRYQPARREAAARTRRNASRREKE